MKLIYWTFIGLACCAVAVSQDTNTDTQSPGSSDGMRCPHRCIPVDTNCQCFPARRMIQREALRMCRQSSGFLQITTRVQQMNRLRLASEHLLSIGYWISPRLRNTRNEGRSFGLIALQERAADLNNTNGNNSFLYPYLETNRDMTLQQVTDQKGQMFAACEQPSTNAECPAGNTMSIDTSKCFFVQNSKQNWDDANSACRRAYQGARLVNRRTTDLGEVRDVIRKTWDWRRITYADLAKKNSTGTYERLWAGLERLGRTRWMRIDRGQVVELEENMWDEGEPDNNGFNENCAEFSRMLNDIRCESRNWFICNIPQSIFGTSISQQVNRMLELS